MPATQSLVRPAWHAYQADAARVFASLGCTVAVEAMLQGARATHKIDVAVVSSAWGIPQTWLIECKYQKRRVSKSAVETLKSISLDVGAEKSFSEAGFQPGAIASAQKTSVTLLSLAELKSNVEPALTKLLLASLEEEALRLILELKHFQVEEPWGETGTLYRGVPGVDFQNVVRARGELHALCSALQAAKIGEFKECISRVFPSRRKSYVHLEGPNAILIEGSRLVQEITSWIPKQEARASRAARRTRRPSPAADI